MMCPDAQTIPATVPLVEGQADAPLRLEAGIYEDVADADYRADPCPEPSLNASGAKVLLNRSPKAFAAQHPRLRPAHLGDPKPEKLDDKKVIGQAVHKLVLGRGREIVEVDADAWTTKAAKQERAEIHAHGRLAVLKAKMPQVRAAARELRAAMNLPKNTPTELVLVWPDAASDGTPVWCRSMIDAWCPDAITIDDAKTTWGFLSDAYVGKQIGSMGYDFSSAFYRRGMGKLLPELSGRIKTRLSFVEMNEPYDTFINPLTEGDLATCDRMVQAAIDRFAECTATGVWPGVAPTPRSVKIPDWHLRTFLEQELED